MFYIGSHEGRVDDGYKTSSKRCRRAILDRPETFRFRVLEHCSFESRRELSDRETAWLQLIKPSELGFKYYNLKRVAEGGNVFEGKSEQEMSEFRSKMSSIGKVKWSDPKYREKMSLFMPFGGNTFNRDYLKTKEYSVMMRLAVSGEKNGFFGKSHSTEAKAKMSLAKQGVKPNRAKDWLVTSPNGTHSLVKSLRAFLIEHDCADIKITSFIKSGSPINVRGNPDFKLTGWTIQHA